MGRMNNEPRQPDSIPPKRTDSRKERLAAQLRANLRRRKEQARERRAEAEPAKPAQK